ncbi:HMG box domain-containing protein [Meloidogyne graminicola]|uniref:HMG box domain-containing protein n=1 Tax=Meloidogyne graminicola TaxID=189291 RepID=A0A8T0A1C1_9BILA|nr:HMG box domain-containing protein [Meloidogyne graminicola]
MKINNLNNNSELLIKQKLNKEQQQQNLIDLDEIEPTIPLDWLNNNNNKKQIENELIKIPKNNSSFKFKTNGGGVRPWSAYALFFREIQTEIREKSKKNISFGELSKLIAQKWEKMSKKEKMVYSEQLKEHRRRILRAKANVHALKLIFGEENTKNTLIN